MEQQRVKSLNADARGGKNRLRFASAKKRAKKASADVYRSYKRRTGGVTSAATREERVHDFATAPRRRKKRRTTTTTVATAATILDGSGKRGKDSKTAVLRRENDDAGGSSSSDEEELDASVATFSAELDLALDRNASELFRDFHRAVWPLVQSLPEVLHHAGAVVDLLMSYVLSPASSPSFPSPESTWKDRPVTSGPQDAFVPNHATTDVLHLLGVLGRDLRHEIHPYVHAVIVPRIVRDLLNPPPPPPESGRQATPLDVTIVEAAFRTLSYVFRYDASMLLAEGGSDDGAGGDSGCLESMRRYYGATLAHKRDYVRRLAAETLAPLVRKLRTDGARRRHVGRVVRALASSAAAAAKASSSFRERPADDVTPEEDEEVEGGRRTVAQRFQRAQSDAVDGVSLLLLHVCKGTPGRLHSKGGPVIRCVLDCLEPRGDDSKSKKGRKRTQLSASSSSRDWEGGVKSDALFSVASEFMYKLRGHVRDGAGFAVVWDELHRSLEKNVVAVRTSHRGGDEEPCCAADRLGCIVQIMYDCVAFRGGALLCDDENPSTNGKQAERIVEALRVLLCNDLYDRISAKSQASVLRLLCAAWKANPSHQSFVSRLGRFLPSIARDVHPPDGTAEKSILDPALFLAEDLLPFLPRTLALRTLAPALLESAVLRIDDNPDRSLVLVHAVATVQFCGDGDDNSSAVDEDDDDDLFSMENARNCALPASNRESLLNLCLHNISSKDLEQKEYVSRLSYVSRCVPFLACLHSESNKEDTKRTSVAKRVYKWCLTELSAVDKVFNKNESRSTFSVFGLIVAKSIVLQALASIAIECPTLDGEESMVQNTLTRAKYHANSLLLSHPSSLWTVKGVSAIVKALDCWSMQLNDTQNETFDLLLPNLGGTNHFLRLHTLIILNSYPRKPFVTDHAELDLSEDLDEEQSFRPATVNKNDEARGTNMDINDVSRNQGPSPSSSPSISGPCSLLSNLLSLELMPVNLSNERRLTSEISRVEVLGRTGKLPAVYAEAAAFHMFGIFNVKFAPLWPAAVRAIVALASGHEDSIWPSIEMKLKQVMTPASCNANTSDISCHSRNSACSLEGNISTATSYLVSILKHQNLCVAWDLSSGEDARLYDKSQTQADGRVSRHQCTDNSTIFQLVWGVMEGVPQLTTRKSRIVVPTFFDFLHEQYYQIHFDDSDAREFRLSDHILNPCNEVSEKWGRDDLGRKSLQKKLVSFLKMFAAVNGPQQLFKHKVLLEIFFAKLSDPDAEIAQLALSCIERFKLPYIMPYAEQLRNLLKKGVLRETLTKFDMSMEGEIVDTTHRSELIPVLTRILFGRLSARGASGGKSSKDSPASRRAAILSFLTTIGQNEGELDYFVYMMTRVFIPQTVKMDQSHDRRAISRLIDSTRLITPEDIFSLKTQRLEGFLNILSDVVSQLGFGVAAHVPTFLHLVLVICEFTEQHSRSVGNNNGKIEKTDKGAADDRGEKASNQSRLGNVRTLCFRRLSEILTKFASSSFGFSVYGERLWRAMSKAVKKLPSTVINAEKPPSLLLLLESLSSHHELVPLLQQNESAVTSVFRCIASTSRFHVVDCALKFVDNLLTEGGVLENMVENDEIKAEAVGRQLVLQNLHLLIAQFNERLKSEPSESVSTVGTPDRASRQTQTAGRELTILCSVSELLVTDKSANSSENVETMESLCGLLVPFLKFERGTNESTQLDVLRILRSIVPRITSQAALLHLHSISKLLGPNKAAAGITSFEIRQLIVSVIDAIAEHVGPALRRVAQSLAHLTASDPKHVEEHNFEEVLPVLNNLGSKGEGSWMVHSGAMSLTDNDMPRNGNGTSGPQLLTPLLYTCFHFLYDADGVVSRGANKALRTLVSVSAEHACNDLNKKEGSTTAVGADSDPWIKLIEKTFVPCIKVGLSTRNTSVRRNFVLLLAEVSRSFSQVDSVHLYSDLSSLIRSDNPDLDFFLNVTHVQIHRRSRAFGRLRKMLSASLESAPFSQQSLGNVLLPLAVHPIHESKTKSEETYALEAIATVGAIAKHLTWNKYQSTLWMALLHMSRYPDQERYIIGMVCAIIDAFHFEVVQGEGDDKEKGASGCGNAVWRSLKNRFIPKIENFMVKEKVAQGGSIVKTLRSPIALALVKLFQKLPKEVFERKLPGLLAIVCGALKNKDSTERDVARGTLANMASSIDIKYLSAVVRELAVSLSEGYQLHVRSATLHSVLLAVSKRNEQIESPPLEDAACSPFDRCIPAIMNLISEDLFGTASEMKEVEHVQKRTIKEAVGSKSYDSLEIISRTILFRPSLAATATHKSGNISAVHAIVSPLLDRLRDPKVDNATVGKVKECLNRVVVGISHNRSVVAEELLPFVYATILPFAGEDNVADGEGNLLDESSDDNDDEDLQSIQVSKTGKKKRSSMEMAGKGASSKGREVAEWLPSTLQSLKDAKRANEMKQTQKAELHKVSDGASAPKLTGASRYDPKSSASKSLSLNELAHASAVAFGLSLLNSSLKRSKLTVADPKTLAMADPFVPMLTKCVGCSSDNQVIMLSLKCLEYLLKMDLPSAAKCSKKLGSSTLALLTATGAASNARNETTQACFKALTLLLSLSRTDKFSSEKMAVETSASPLDKKQMQALVLLLHSSVTDSDHYNATFSLVKAIAAKRYASTEFYDLMDVILRLTVQSQKATVRQQSCQIFMQFLVEYPMGKKRIEQHLKQIVLNIKYKYEEGRMSAIELLASIIQKLPSPMLEEYAQLFFLPLVLQLVNDDSKKCRECVANCISSLLKRLSVDTVQSLFDYVTRWAVGDGAEDGSLKRTSAQVFGLFVDARRDFVKRGTTATDLISFLTNFLGQSVAKSSADDGSGWELTYYSLICLEKMNAQLPTALAEKHPLWSTLVKCLVYPHPWVKTVSTRIIYSHISTLDPQTFAAEENDSLSSFLTCVPGSIYEIGRNICHQLNSDNEQEIETLSVLATKVLSWIVKAMHYHPSLCFRADSDQEENGSSREVLQKDLDASKNPVLWLMTRLSNIAKARGHCRREAIFKCFAAFATSCDVAIIAPYMELMLEPIHRAISEAPKTTDNDNRREQQGDSRDAADLVKDVMQLLEDTCGTEVFLKAYATVKTRAKEKRKKRKQEVAAEAVHDPQAAALRKVKKQEREKNRRKRKVEEKKASRGVFGKKQRG